VTFLVLNDYKYGSELTVSISEYKRGPYIDSNLYSKKKKILDKK